MTEIIPAILPKNYEDLKNKISLVKETVSLVQVDICDGVFVKSMTWPFYAPSSEGVARDGLDQHFQNILNEQEGMPFWEDVDFELDLMVSDAVENFDIYTKLGPKRIIFHLEAVGDLQNFKEFLEGIDSYVRDSMEIGVAINPQTPVEQIFPIVNNIDFVQCMAIAQIGYQGEPFDERCISHIKILKEKFPDLIISVDGGINMETGARLTGAGADRLAIGSAIFNTDDIIDTIEQFRNL
jgi:ribulose-phosphate 3-epimerase